MPPKRRGDKPAAASSSSKRKCNTKQETTILPINSSASSPRRNRAKQGENIIPALGAGSSETTMDQTYEQGQRLVRHLITYFNIPSSGLNSEGSSFSHVKYVEAAPRVGLDPYQQLHDIPTFEMYRSRIPTNLFKEIVTDLDTMMLQYGPPHVHENEEARSRFFSPVFDHLVKQFTFMLRNEPAIIKGRNGTRGRIEYFFKAFDAVVILCVEMLGVGNKEERLDAIAQVIAECDRCDANNGDCGYLLPVLCILSDGLTFEFFKFTRDRLHSRASFFRGCFLGDPEHLQHGLVLLDTKTMESTLPFILQLRRICETVFDIMLNAYIIAIKAFHGQLASESGHEGPSLDAWDQALKSANSAMATLRAAEKERQKGDIDSADMAVLEGIRLLNESTGAVSTAYKSNLFTIEWDEDEIRKT